jgi:hypothetical protein
MRSSPLSPRMASAARNAAEDGSPGTVRSSGGSCAGGESITTRHPPGTGSVSTPTPRSLSMRSVWSRETTGSVTVTGTAPLSPASSTALLICALALGDA